MHSRWVLALLKWTAFSCLVPAFLNTSSECKQRYPQSGLPVWCRDHLNNLTWISAQPSCPMQQLQGRWDGALLREETWWWVSFRNQSLWQNRPARQSSGVNAALCISPGANSKQGWGCHKRWDPCIQTVLSSVRRYVQDWEPHWCPRSIQ